MQIKSDKGRLSQEEIRQMVAEAEANVRADEEKRRAVESKNALEAYLYSSKSSSSSSGSLGAKLTKAEKEKIKDVVAENLKWLDSHQNDSFSVYDDKLKSVEAIISPLLKSAYENT